MPFTGSDFGPPMFISIFGNLIFIVVISGILFLIVRGVITWSSNNASPIETIVAQVITKRTRHRENRTTYYVTFEIQNGERREFHVRARHFALLAEHDTGTLQFQGTRFISFDRKQGMTL